MPGGRAPGGRPAPAGCHGHPARLLLPEPLSPPACTLCRATGSAPTARLGGRRRRVLQPARASASCSGRAWGWRAWRRCGMRAARSRPCCAGMRCRRPHTPAARWARAAAGGRVVQGAGTAEGARSSSERGPQQCSAVAGVVTAEAQTRGAACAIGQPAQAACPPDPSAPGACDPRRRSTTPRARCS